jgi:NAD(P)-dependent dehydrogenase (short-subunit alcohol dehydrogenase family)
MGCNPLGLAGKRILVTGASSGIGRDTAILLSQLGANVVLAGRDRVRLEQTSRQLEGSGHSVQPRDLLPLEGIPSWIKEISEAIGALDGIVHSAGVYAMTPVTALNAQKLEEMLRMNVGSALMIAKAYKQRGCWRPGGSIVYVSSIAGIIGVSALASYASSKAALIGLTRSLSIEFARDGIRVNCVAPGFVQTEMVQELQSRLTPEQLAEIARMHPLGLGKPRDIAHAIAFLIGDASRWITGSTLVVDGGYTAH